MGVTIGMGGLIDLGFFILFILFEQFIKTQVVNFLFTLCRGRSALKCRNNNKDFLTFLFCFLIPTPMVVVAVNNVIFEIRILPDINFLFLFLTVNNFIDKVY